MERKSPVNTIIIVLVIAIGIKTFAPRLFDKSYVSGESFTAQAPKGWTVKKDKHEITFTSDSSDIFTGMPEAIFSIYAEKKTDALFMDDFWPELLASMQRENGKILNTGVELIGGQNARWVLFRYEEPDIAVISLYIADDYNRLTIIRFVGILSKFKEYGKLFTTFKKSIKFKGIM